VSRIPSGEYHYDLPREGCEIEIESATSLQSRETNCCGNSRSSSSSSSSSGTTLGLILWSYGFMALGRGRWLRDSRSREEPENSPWCWWNAGRANRGRPACASFPCIPYSLSRPSALSHPEFSLSPSPSLPPSLSPSPLDSLLILSFSFLRSFARTRRTRSAPRRFISFFFCLSLSPFFSGARARV